MNAKAARLTSMRLVITPFLILVTFVVGVSIAFAQSYGDGAHITGDQTIDGVWGEDGAASTLYLDANIAIDAGVTITVLPNTTIVVANGGGITVNGTLNIDGPVTFTSASAIPGDWLGLTYASGSSGYLDQTVIEYAKHALTLETINPIGVTDSTIRYNKHQPAANATAFGAGLHIVRGNHLIEGVSVYGNAIIASGTGEARGAGIYIAGGASPQILDSRIYENAIQAAGARASGGGIGINQGAALIRGCRVTTNTIGSGWGDSLKSGAGIGIMGNTSAVIRDSWIAGNDVDAANWGGGGGIGFWTDATALLIDANVIANNRAWGSGQR